MQTFKAQELLMALEDNLSSLDTVLDAYQHMITHRVQPQTGVMAVWLDDGSSVVLSGVGLRAYDPGESPARVQDYQILSLRTAPKLDMMAQLVHCVMGIVGELREVAYAEPEKVAGEIGDVCWYIAVAAATLHHRLEPIDTGVTTMRPHLRVSVATEALMVAADMANQVKKDYFYGNTPVKPLYISWLDRLWLAAHNLSTLCVPGGTMEVLSLNHRKLAARYSVAFSSEEATNRNDAAEDAAMAGEAP